MKNNLFTFFCAIVTFLSLSESSYAQRSGTDSLSFVRKYLKDHPEFVEKNRNVRTEKFVKSTKEKFTRPAVNADGTNKKSGKFHFYSDPEPLSSAQTMIDSYGRNMLKDLSIRSFKINIQQLKNYFDLATQENIPIADLQILFARKGDQSLTLIITTVDANGHHYLFPNDYGGGNTIRSVLENCMPCPPPAGCEANSTNLSY